MDTVTFETWDVFTDTAFSGNPLAIVETDGGLSTAQMQTVAREFNLSETIFLMPPANPAHTARARIFFPTAEIPFAGHPTIGAALYLAARDGLSKIVLEEEAGLVPVTIEGARARFTAPVVPAPRGEAVPVGLCAQALGLSDGAIGPHAPQVHVGGPAFLFVPVADRDTLRRARPMEPAWTALMTACDVDSAFLYDPTFNTRMFSPGAGIPEDPATGSASAILASQLHVNGALPEGTTRIDLRQGEDMGRRSDIAFDVEVRGGRIAAVGIAGQAVPVSRGRIRIP